MAKKKPETVDLKITSAVMIGGKMVVPGKGKKSEVEVSGPVARDLLRRGKADLLTSENVAADKKADNEKAAADKAAGKS